MKGHSWSGLVWVSNPNSEIVNMRSLPVIVEKEKKENNAHCVEKRKVKTSEEELSLRSVHIYF
uniref:Uncharacterized protein n=1 Tax=Manihot esculenta TaxID=3983 RepID=A0A2C9UXT3_MANES